MLDKGCVLDQDARREGGSRGRSGTTLLVVAGWFWRPQGLVGCQYSKVDAASGMNDAANEIKTHKMMGRGRRGGLGQTTQDV